MAEALHATALRLLAGRALSEAELTARLARRGFPPALVLAEVERLRQTGLVDDFQVARATCAALLRRGYGRKRLAAALARRGVSQEVAREVLAEVSASAEEAALCRALARLAPPGDHSTLPGERARMVRYLLARGFPASLVRRVGGGGKYDEAPDIEPFDE